MIGRYSEVDRNVQRDGSSSAHAYDEIDGICAHVRWMGKSEIEWRGRADAATLSGRFTETAWEIQRDPGKTQRD